MNARGPPRGQRWRYWTACWPRTGAVSPRSAHPRSAPIAPRIGHPAERKHCTEPQQIVLTCSFIRVSDGERWDSNPRHPGPPGSQACSAPDRGHNARSGTLSEPRKPRLTPPRPATSLPFRSQNRTAYQDWAPRLWGGRSRAITASETDPGEGPGDLVGAQSCAWVARSLSQSVLAIYQGCRAAR
jgi:hypothetical protein